MQPQRHSPSEKKHHCMYNNKLRYINFPPSQEEHQLLNWWERDSIQSSVWCSCQEGNSSQRVSASLVPGPWLHYVFMEVWQKRSGMSLDKHLLAKSHKTDCWLSLVLFSFQVCFLCAGLSIRRSCISKSSCRCECFCEAAGFNGKLVFMF